MSNRPPPGLSPRRVLGLGWEFVTGGKGYQGGLEELVQEYGIDVS
ncbi:hypothetical protein [Streptomyces sp. NPDC048248]